MPTMKVEGLNKFYEKIQVLNKTFYLTTKDSLDMNVTDVPRTIEDGYVSVINGVIK